MRIMLRGLAGCCSSAMRAAAASTCTQGWQTLSTWAPGPIAVESKRSVGDRDVARVVGVAYRDLGADPCERPNKERLAARLMRTLKQLGEPEQSHPSGCLLRPW